MSRVETKARADEDRWACKLRIMAEQLECLAGDFNAGTEEHKILQNAAHDFHGLSNKCRQTYVDCMLSCVGHGMKDDWRRERWIEI